MGTAIDMSGVCWDVKPWNRVMEHVKVSAQGVPSNLRNAIAAFATMNGSKLKWSMNEGISVGEVQILSIREETMLFGIGFRCVGWSNVMSVCGRGGANNVVLTVVLEPEPLVDSIIMGIGRMREVEVHQITDIHHAGGIEGHVSSKATRTKHHSQISPEPMGWEMKKSLSALKMMRWTKILAGGISGAKYSGMDSGGPV